MKRVLTTIINSFMEWFKWMSYPECPECGNSLHMSIEEGKTIMKITKDIDKSIELAIYVYKVFNNQ